MKLKEQYHRFREWQQQPYQVRPLSDEEHVCATCGTSYRGNYCPRCGQSSTVGRYSFKNAFLLFLDVWGLGNRGMFRTLRDLILRPGYMIRDYLQGMQMAYFPPFKMFFLLVALSVFVDTGFNITGENRIDKEFDNTLKKYDVVVLDGDDAKTAKPDVTSVKNDAKDNADAKTQEDNADAKPQKASADTEKAKTSDSDREEVKKTAQFYVKLKKMGKWVLDHQTVLQLLWLLVFSAPLYLLFRHSPNIPDIRYSEFFVAMVYTTNLMTMASIVCGFLSMGTQWEILTTLLSIFPLKQLSGYSYKRTLLNVVAAFIILMLALILLAILTIMIIVALFGH